MIDSLFFIGEPFEFKPGILIYPPKVKDVITNQHYNTYSRMLTFSQEEIEDIFVENGQQLEQYPTPLEFLLGNSFNNREYEKIAKESFSFFIKKDVTFLYEEKKILIGKLEDILKKVTSVEQIVYIDEDNFFDFQNYIRQAINVKVVEKPDPDEHPRIKAMKAKMRLRDRVKAKQNGGISLFTSMNAICCMGIGITPLNIGEMSYTAIFSIMNMYQDKEKYDLDIRSLLAGADSKKIKPEYWIKNSEK